MTMLKHATTAERNAAFDSVYKDLSNIIDQWVPYLFKSQAHDKLKSAEGRTLTLKVIDDALDAAAAVRAKEPQP